MIYSENKAFNYLKPSGYVTFRQV